MTIIAEKQNEYNCTSADELIAMAEIEGKRELVYGKIVEMAPVGTRHAIVVSRLIRMLYFIEDKNMGIVVTELGFILAKDPDLVRAPDIAIISKKNIPDQGLPDGYWDGPPDYAVEVLSLSDSMSSILLKIKEYLDAGSQFVWVIDPMTKCIEVYDDKGNISKFLESDKISDKILLKQFKLPLNKLFEF